MKNRKKIDLNLIVDRIKQLCGVTEQKQVANIMGLSPSDFSKRKKSGTLLKIITEWAIDQNVNLNYLLTGREGAWDQVEVEDALIIRCMVRDISKLKKEVVELRARLDKHPGASGHFGALK